MKKVIIIGAGSAVLSVVEEILKTASCTEVVLVVHSKGGFIGGIPDLSIIDRKVTLEVDNYNLHKNTYPTKDTHSTKNHNRPNNHRSKRPYHNNRFI